jgi:nucleoside-diphosphate-sugar epimerase
MAIASPSLPPGSTILLTGSSGFIGGHLVKRLASDSVNVHVIVRANSNTEPLTQLIGAERMHVHDGTTSQLFSILASVKPSAVFHLASLFLAQHTPADISRLVASNIEFPLQLLEAMVAADVRLLINTGTAWQHFENADYNPVNLYAATKQAFVDLARFRIEMKAIQMLHLELFDTFGPGDTRPKLFTALRSASEAHRALDMSRGEQLIDLVYVDDVIDAFMMAAAHLFNGESPSLMETFAVSSGRPLPLRDIVETWRRVTGRPLEVNWGARPYRPREVMVPWNRGLPVPGWRPGVSLEDGIRRMEHAD